MNGAINEKMGTLIEDRAIEEFVNKWCQTEPRLHDKVNAMMAEKGVSLSQLMSKSQINRNYGYNIINGKRTNPSRDKVLAICIALKLSLTETQELLAIAKVGTLYYRRERDVRIAAAINKAIGDVIKVNLILAEQGLEPLNM